MKTKVFLILLVWGLLQFSHSNAQYGYAVPNHIATSSIQQIPDAKPSPTFEFNQYLSENMQYPEAARQIDLTGKVSIGFAVEEDGSVSDITILEGGQLGGGLPEEALRVIKTMPTWKPAIKNGKPTRAFVSVPINFVLQEEKMQPFGILTQGPSFNPSTPQANIVNQKNNQMASMNYNFEQYVAQHLKYPEAAVQKKIEGDVIVAFNVETDGRITNANIIAGKLLGHGMPQEALRLVSSMPKWTPAKMNGKLIRSTMTLTIKFKLNSK